MPLDIAFAGFAVFTPIILMWFAWKAWRDL